MYDSILAMLWGRIGKIYELIYNNSINVFMFFFTPFEDIIDLVTQQMGLPSWVGDFFTEAIDFLIIGFDTKGATVVEIVFGGSIIVFVFVAIFKVLISIVDMFT